MDAEPADIRSPSKCWDLIRTGALVAINTRGDKDSQGMTILGIVRLKSYVRIFLAYPVNAHDRYM